MIELLSNPIFWGASAFVVVCSCHNFSSGRAHGVQLGIDATLAHLAAGGIINLQETEDEIFITSTDGDNKIKLD